MIELLMLNIMYAAEGDVMPTEREHMAATKIQKVYKGYKVRHYLKTIIAEYRQSIHELNNLIGEINQLLMALDVPNMSPASTALPQGIGLKEVYERMKTEAQAQIRALETQVQALSEMFSNIP